MKYAKGQFGELFSLDDRGRLLTCHGKFPTYEERERLMHCANALECLDPDAMPKIAEWWRLARNRMDHPSNVALNAMLDQLIGVDDADNG